MSVGDEERDGDLSTNLHSRGAVADGIIDTTPIHQQVYRHLRLRIMQGRYNPGETLSIRAVASELGVSPLPVRDAFGRLVVERALEMPHARSFRVVKLSLQEFRDVCDLRTLIEGYAIERSASHVTKADLQELRALDVKIMVAIDKGDLREAFELNQSFMFYLYTMGGMNSEVLPLIELLWLRSGPLVSLRIQRIRQARMIEDVRLTRHKEILGALSTHDGKAAKDEISREIDETFNIVKELTAPEST